MFYIVYSDTVKGLLSEAVSLRSLFCVAQDAACSRSAASETVKYGNHSELLYLFASATVLKTLVEVAVELK